MSELDDAVRDRIDAYRPALVPPFGQLQHRRRARRRLQWSASIAGVAAVAAAITVVLVLPGGTKHGRSVVSTQPTTLAAQFDGYVASTESTWPTTRDGGVAETKLVRGPAHCDSERTLWLLPPPPGPLQDGSRPAVGYLRDPGHTADNFAKAAKPFLSPAALPADATFTGLSVGVAELWSSPAEGAEDIYLVNSEDRTDVERWPALGGLCA